MKINQTLETESKEEKIFTVSEYIDFLNQILIPQKAVIQGEIGRKIDVRPKYSTFNLLDKSDKSVLKCLIWENRLENLGIELKGGMEIKAFGFPKIYKSEYGSEFEFQIEEISLIGEGILKQAFEALKRKLEGEGLFKEEFKKPIPRFCQRIGLITSKYGKGAKPDFERHLEKYGFEVYFYDVRVEGLFAINEICEAIRWFNENMLNLDVLALIRGGGDWESLQSFNSEQVGRAIFASKIPIISGVGHESDVTIADYVADLRASTPTDAAKILSESWKLASGKIFDYEKNLRFLSNQVFKNVKEKIISFEENFTAKIKNLLKDQKLNIQQILKDLIKNKNRWKEKIEKLLIQQEEQLIPSSPQLKLKQGYTITSDKFGKIIKDPTKLKISQTIETKFYKGQVLSKINKIKKYARGKI